MIDPFEVRLARDLAAYADELIRPVDAMAVAERVMRKRRLLPWPDLRRTGPAPVVIWLAALLVVALATLLIVSGGQTRRPLAVETSPTRLGQPGRSLTPAQQLGFRPAGAMTWDAGAAIAAGLLDGRVLVVHGSRADLYDEARNAYVQAGIGINLPEGLQDAETATTLLDGRVLLTSGDGRSWLFDAGPGEFREGPPMRLSRGMRYSATLLLDGRVLFVGGLGPSPFAGGQEGESATRAMAEVFDPGTNAFLATGSLVEGRFGHAAARLADGRVLIAGGETQTPFDVSSFGIQTLDSAELFDPESEAFRPAGAMLHPRNGLTLTALADGRVLAAGGRGNSHPIWSATEVFDPSSNGWSAAGEMVGWRLDAGALQLTDGRVLVVGGQAPPYGGPDFHQGETFDPGPTNPIDGLVAELFDPATQGWALTGQETVERYRPSLVLLRSGAVFVAGGTFAAEGSATNVPDEVFAAQP